MSAVKRLILYPVCIYLFGIKSCDAILPSPWTWMSFAHWDYYPNLCNGSDLLCAAYYIVMCNRGLSWLRIHFSKSRIPWDRYSMKHECLDSGQADKCVKWWLGPYAKTDNWGPFCAHDVIYLVTGQWMLSMQNGWPVGDWDVTRPCF